MKFHAPGYSESQFDNKLLLKRVAELKMAIPAYMNHFGAQAIAVTGKSGLSLAFATLSHIDFPLIAVRKGGESSHGYNVEGTENVDVSRYLILDDLVASGETVRNIVKAIGDHAACVGVIAWDVFCGDDPYRAVRSKGNYEDADKVEVPVMGTRGITLPSELIYPEVKHALI